MAKVIYHLGTGTYFEFDNDVFVVDTDNGEFDDPDDIYWEEAEEQGFALVSLIVEDSEGVYTIHRTNPNAPIKEDN